MLAIIALLVWAGCSTPLPEGVADERADALARKMMASVNAEAWARTGAITWTYADRNNHLWDRRRQLARVQSDDLRVFIDLRTREGVALRGEERLEGDELDEAVEEAYAAWVNDSFWLTAMIKPFDPGTTRYRVPQEDGGEALLVQYDSGGVTPGDAYLWHLDENGRPVSWDMWVSIIPIGGVSSTWDGWVELPTGAWVSTAHKVGPLNIEVTHLDAAKTMTELIDGADPFEVLAPE